MPVINPGGGGGGASYTAPTDRQQLTGNAVSINNGASANLPWSSSFGPNTLLDRSVDTTPSIITSGVYIVTLGVTVTALTAGGYFQAALHLDRDNEDAVTRATEASTAVLTQPQLVLTLAYYIPAAGTIRVTVFNGDGASAQSFSLLEAIVQRVS